MVSLGTTNLDVPAKAGSVDEGTIDSSHTAQTFTLARAREHV